MSTNLVLPRLTPWAEQHVSAILQATDSASFDNAFDAFVSVNAKITVNGVDTSRDNYKSLIQGEKFDEAGATVSFNGAVEVLADPTNSFGAGAVGLFYTAVVARNLLVHDAPIESQVTASLNIIVETDPAVPAPHLPPNIHGGFFDPRRVTVLNQVAAAGPVPQTGASGST
ncbi:hypothetical protein BD779DRAFT_249239 [Infundibulicybe gibba]|nr:hypothetical protein BD779DRAFT_249239 [Infundibulicybe gibba]